MSEEKVAPNLVWYFGDTALRQNSLHEFTRNVGQAVVAALGAEDHAGMIDSKLLQDRRLKVMHVHRIVGDIVTVVIGRAVGHTRFDARARQPDGETARVMVAAVV